MSPETNKGHVARRYLSNKKIQLKYPIYSTGKHFAGSIIKNGLVENLLKVKSY